MLRPESTKPEAVPVDNHPGINGVAHISVAEPVFVHAQFPLPSEEWCVVMPDSHDRFGGVVVHSFLTRVSWAEGRFSAQVVAVGE